MLENQGISGVTCTLSVRCLCPSVFVTLVLTDRLLAEDEVTGVSVWTTHLYMFEVGELTDLTNLTYLTTSYTGLSIVRGYRVIISQRIQGDPWQQDTG